jgi:VWFA-related protein
MASFLLRAGVVSALALPLLAFGQTDEPMITIHKSTNLVVVDVVVTDAHQNPVHGLTAADFHLFEGNQAQQIKNFEEHSSAAAAAEALPAVPKLPAGTFTNYTAAPANGSLDVVVLDTLNTPLAAQSYVRDQLLKYLKEAPPGRRVAVFGLGQHLYMIQGFTSDPEVLKEALKNKKSLPKGSPLFTNSMTGDAAGGDNTELEAATEAAAGQPPESQAAEFLANLQQFMAEEESFQTQMRIRYTLDAFNDLGRYLSSLPGRKNLIWFSGAFPINLMPDGDLKNPFAIAANFEDEFRQTVNLLARSQVAVYPVDARGLMVTPMYDASNSGRRYGSSPSAFNKDLQNFSQRTSSEQSSMTQMAVATGGKAFFNTNGLKEAVEKAVEAGSNYYTLTYSPGNTDWHGEYRKIKVDLARQGVTLSYRRGYYADDPNAPVHHGEPVASAHDHPKFDPMSVAMVHGGPATAEIPFLVKIRPVSAGTEATLAKDNKDDGLTNGPYRRFRVNFGLRPGDLSCPDIAGGGRHCEIEFVTYVYAADGKVVNTRFDGIKVDIPANRLLATYKAGMQLHQDVSVPVRGEYTLRVGVHDMIADHVGATELPVAQLAKQPPLEEPASSAATPAPAKPAVDATPAPAAHN